MKDLFDSASAPIPKNTPAQSWFFMSKAIIRITFPIFYQLASTEINPD
ncbi:hypothetical protein [Gilliamella apicola]|nr:hypothetical protein [Gilliamella apicola]